MMTLLILVLAAIITGCIVALVNLARADSYAKHTQEFRTNAQRERDDEKWDREFAGFEFYPSVEAAERRLSRRLLAADRARIEGATDL